MRFSEITEAIADNVVVFYGGRFQPMHVAHKQVYQHLVQKFDASRVFIATMVSAKVQGLIAKVDAGGTLTDIQQAEMSKNPFTFDEKANMMSTMHGIPTDKIINTNPYNPDISKIGMDPNNTAVIVVYSAKDAGRLSPTAYKPYKEGEQLQPLAEIQYVYVAPEMQGGMSASDFRNAMKSNASDQEKAQVFQKFFGKFDKEVFTFINGRLNENR